jgi:hypothetical protein
VEYDISFVGAPGGALAGMSGVTTGKADMSLAEMVAAPAMSGWGLAILTGSLLAAAIAWPRLMRWRSS